jgi:4-amino-4-deoxy-L-arabinose transferase-like glycosyltransferase
MKSPLSAPTWLGAAALILLAAVLTLNRLDAAPVCGVNEAVEGVFLQQMVEHGHLLFPLDNGSEPMYKPPLFHWSALTLDRLAGVHRVSAFNLRLPAALYAIATVALTIGFTGAALDGPCALLAGLILVSSYQFVSQGRMGRVDMTLTFCEALSLFAFCWWSGARDNPHARRKAAHYLLAASLGLGVLAKGPVGALLPGAAVVLFLLMERRARDLLALVRPGPLIVGATLACSWYAICLFGGRYSFLDRQLGSENFGRFFGSLGFMPIGYYLQPLLLNAGPLSLLIPVAAVTALLRARRPHKLGAKDHREECLRLFALFWFVTALFFELAAYKRKSYLLPLWPPSAILLAWWTLRVAAPRWRWATAAIATLCGCLIVANFFYIPWREVRDCDSRLGFAQALRWPIASLRGQRVVAMDPLRRAVAQIDKIVIPGQPLFAYDFDASIEPLGFYLERTVPLKSGPLASLPPGYVLIPQAVWARHKSEAKGFTPLLTMDYRHGLILLRHDVPAPSTPKGAG